MASRALGIHKKSVGEYVRNSFVGQLLWDETIRDSFPLPERLGLVMKIRQTGQTGAKAADPADHQIDFHPDLGYPAKCVDDPRIDQGIYLGPDGGEFFVSAT